MPEWGMLPIPTKLVKQGVRDMVRLSDARMSGTSYGACILHVSPESYVGGPLALVRTGDVIALDVEARTVNLEISDAEMAARRAALKQTPRATSAATAGCSHATSARPTKAATSTSSKPASASRCPNPRSTEALPTTTSRGDIRRTRHQGRKMTCVTSFARLRGCRNRRLLDVLGDRPGKVALAPRHRHRALRGGRQHRRHGPHLRRAHGKRLGQQFVVENRAGAGGVTGLNVLTKAAPDGHTVGVATTGGMVINPVLTKDKIPYNVEKDFTHLYGMAAMPNIWIVSPSVPANNLQN